MARCGDVEDRCASNTLPSTEVQEPAAALLGQGKCGHFNGCARCTLPFGTVKAPSRCPWGATYASLVCNTPIVLETRASDW